MDELRVLLNDQNIDYLAINETRLNEGIFDQEVKVQGYDIINRDRSTNGRIGGGISYSVCTDLERAPGNNRDLKIPGRGATTGTAL